MIHYSAAKTNTELQQILELQAANLPESISAEELKKEGFVTVKHTLQLLKDMNDASPHIIAKENDRVVGYTLTMGKSFRNRIPILKPMFDQIDKLSVDGTMLSAVDYVIMGQVCIAKGYRGKGIFQGLYKAMQNQLSFKHPYILTEIDFLNKRSINAHLKTGFEHLYEYRSPDGKDWVIVIWKWQQIPD